MASPEALLGGRADPASLAASLGRIGAVFERHWILLSRSWPRIVDTLYWPTVNIAIWGFIQQAVISVSTGAAVALSAILGAVVLWDLTWRSQLGLALSIYEEIWSRNLGHLLVSPLRPLELVAAAMAVSLAKAGIAILPAAALAAWAFGFNILSLGPALGLFALNLVVFGWSISLLAAGLVIRYGQGAQDMPWALMFGLAPLSAIYYPLDTLPAVLHPLAAAIPASHVFEGLRAIVIDDAFDRGALAWAMGLNVIWCAGGTGAFLLLLAGARRRGGLLQIGE